MTAVDHLIYVRLIFLGQISAFAAARQPKQPPPEPVTELASRIGAEPYDNRYASTLDGEDDETSLIPSRPNVRLSSIPLTAVQETKHVLEVSLEADQSVTLVGEYQLQVLRGLVSIYGGRLHPGSEMQAIYALSTSPLPAIVARKDGSVIRISSIHSSITCLETYSPLFRNIGASGNKLECSFELLSCTADDTLQRPLSSLEIDEDTRKVLSRINARLEESESLRIMAVGPKSSGKSTLNRVLCNMIVTRPTGQNCYYLDLDPGQPEFGPPGQLSLVEVSSPILGPSFTHPSSVGSRRFRLIRSHSLAATSFKDDPELYIHCAADLSRHVPRGAPLVINSCGWVSGSGATSIKELVIQLRLTDVVILSPIESSLDSDIRAKVNTHVIQKRQGRTSQKNPAELRAMQTMAYFHHKATENGLSSWIDKPISEIRPWYVRYTGANAGIQAILCYGQSPHPELWGEVINGMVVAIVQVESDALDLEATKYTSMESLPYVISTVDGCSLPLDPRKSQCLGLALVRGIDCETKRIHLVTPLAEAVIATLSKRPTLLVRGSFDSPNWAYLQDVYQDSLDSMGSDERPWITNQEPMGIEGAVWRLRHPPMAADIRKTR